jgi:hypothetical protein
VSPASASELDVLTTPTPTTGYVLDDAKIMSRSTYSELSKIAEKIEADTARHTHTAALRCSHTLSHALTHVHAPCASSVLPCRATA